MKEYKKRIADKLLEYRLEEVGAVLIEGPKWCGKTTTAEQKTKSVLYMADPDNQNNYLEMANLKIKMLLKGEKPRLIDEWQIIPQIWDAIRFEVDHQGEEGLFILTGAAVPASSEKIHHTGTGRFDWITMRPMALWESGESTGEVSISELFKGNAKLGGAQAIEKGVSTLTALADKIDTTKMKAPSFMMVLTAVGDYAYRREDGVYVVPIGCLKD